MDGGDAGGHHAVSPASPRAEAIAALREARLPAPAGDEDYDDLYGDVNVGFLPLLPLSPSPSPTSPPKTPSPGRLPSPSAPPPPHRVPAPAPEPHPKPAAPRHQPPPPRPPPPAPRHYMPQQQSQPQRAPRGDAFSSSPPSGAALYVSELHWWTTDAEVEAALAPHAAALRGLYFYSDKYTGKSRGICRADFHHPSAAASAAAALHGRAFHGRHCVASLSRPPALQRLGDDSYVEAAPAPNPTRGRGNGGPSRGPSNPTAIGGNVGSALGDRPALAPLPPRSMAPRPVGLPFVDMMGGVGGYGGFQSMGQYNGGMGTGMMPSAVAPHMNSAFLAAGGMPMRGPAVWHDQGMAGGLWGAQQPWNFRGQMPWQQVMPPAQHHQAQQQNRSGDYGKGRVMVRERLGSRSGERSIDNVRSYPKRRQSDNDGGDCYKEYGHEESGRYRQRVPEKEREREGQRDERDRRGSDNRRCQEYTEHNERDRRGGDNRRYQEYTERDDLDRRGRTRSRSQTRDGEDDDYPRKRR
ncbi:hypothetical protein ACP70R_011514 [Stipagrostis hirtigluma subsp. patula]